MRAFVLALTALLGCTRGSASPSPSPVADGGAPPNETRAAANAPLEACMSARASLESFLMSLPTACKSASDCDGYYLRSSACEGPVILAKPGCPSAREADLARIQADARRSCPADPVACSPRPFRTDCRAGRCVDSLALPALR